MTHDIAIVGGGVAGTVLANRLADELRTEIRDGDATVTLYTDDPTHVYKPLFLYVAFGRKRPEEAERDERDLLDGDVALEVARVVDVDTDGKTLTLADAEDGGTGDGGRTQDATVGYDTLAVGTGADLAPGAVPGLEDAHHFYGRAGAERLREALAGFDGGDVVLTVAGMPHMCPVAPVEFAFIVEEWLAERGVDADVTYTYPVDAVHAKDALADWLPERFADRGIATETGFEVAAFDGTDGVGTVEAEDGRTVEGDCVVAIPPHTGSDLIVDAGLGDPWIDVDRHTLEAEAADDVYAVGDAAAVPTSKAGSAAHYQTGALARRIGSRVRGETPTARYDGKTFCFVETGLDEATYIEFGYGEEPPVPEPSRYIHWAKLSYNESYWLTARGLV